MPNPDRTKEKTPAAPTAEVLDAKTKPVKERTKPMNSIANPHVVPALSFSLDDLQLRVVMIEGEPWFVAADVCALLDVKNVTQAVARLDADERAMFNIGRQGDSSIVSEPGLYSLILGSRKPEASKFKRWVTHEVLPSIRKTGSYSVKKQVPSDRQIKLAQSLVMSIERSQSKPCRDALIMLARSAFGDLRMELPDMSRLQPLQLPLVQEGVAA